jgi:hypothetical protein
MSIEKKRNDFSESSTEYAMKKQEGRCKNCGIFFGGEPQVEFQADHADGDRSNNTKENCVLLCQPCHSATFHASERDAYLADMGFLKEKIKTTIDLALERKTNGTVIDAVHTLLKEYKQVSDRILEVTSPEAAHDLNSKEMQKSDEVKELEEKLAVKMLERQIALLENPVLEPTKEYMRGFEEGIKVGAELGKGLRSK